MQGEISIWALILILGSIVLVVMGLVALQRHQAKEGGEIFRPPFHLPGLLCADNDHGATLQTYHSADNAVGDKHLHDV